MVKVFLVLFIELSIIHVSNDLVKISDLLLGWDGEGWDDLLLGGFLLLLTLENFLEELLVLLLSTFVLR